MRDKILSITGPRVPKGRLTLLLRVARMLRRRKFKKSEFDMGFFRIDKKCGTACCAVGWACTLPSVKTGTGLRLESLPMPPWFIGNQNYRLIYVNSVGQVFQSFDAIDRAFGLLDVRVRLWKDHNIFDEPLRRPASHALFYDGAYSQSSGFRTRGYVRPVTVAARIEEFVALECARKDEGL
jgi:hypothetical protein